MGERKLAATSVDESECDRMHAHSFFLFVFKIKPVLLNQHKTFVDRKSPTPFRTSIQALKSYDCTHRYEESNKCKHNFVSGHTLLLDVQRINCCATTSRRYCRLSGKIDMLYVHLTRTHKCFFTCIQDQNVFFLSFSNPVGLQGQPVPDAPQGPDRAEHDQDRGGQNHSDLQGGGHQGRQVGCQCEHHTM